MKTYAVLPAAVALLGLTSLAPAAQLLSPPLATGVNAAGACYFRNVGPTPITLHVKALSNFTPDFITPDFQNCNDAPLAAGHTCVLLVDDLPDDTTFACAAKVTGSAKNLRTSIEIRDLGNGLKVLLADQLR
jgi:hypothetical protein